MDFQPIAGGMPDLTQVPDLTQDLLLPGSTTPSAMPDFVEEFKPKVKPHLRSWLETRADYETSKGELGEYLEAAQKGVRPEEVDKTKFADKAMQLAASTTDLSDEKYNELVERIRAEINTPTAKPEMPQLEAPNLAQGIVAAYGALSNPQHAYDIGAAPFQAQLQKQKQGYAQNVQDYEIAEGQRKERLSWLGTELQMSEKRRDDAYSQLYKMAEDARKNGDKLTADGLSARADLFKAKSVAELVDKVQMILQNYGQDFLPPKDTLMALEADLNKATSLEAEKSRLDGVKATQDAGKAKNEQDNKEYDNYLAWVNSQYPAGVSLGKAEIARINEQRQSRATRTGLPISYFPAYSERTATAPESLQFQKDRYNGEIESESRRIGLDIDKEQLEALRKKKADAITTTPEAKDKRAQIKARTAAWEKAKTDTDLFLAQDRPTDPDERGKYDAKLRSMLIDEWVLLTKKRESAGGKGPTYQVYLAERFPGAAKVVTGLFGVIPDKGSKLKPVTSADKKQLFKNAPKGNKGTEPFVPPSPPSGFGPGK